MTLWTGSPVIDLTKPKNSVTSYADNFFSTAFGGACHAVHDFLSFRSMDVTAVDGGSFDMEETRLTEDIIKGFVQLVNFKEPQGPVTSLSFSDDGELCVTTSLDQTLNIYNCVTGE